jgi:Cu2+-exporting ATPase
VSAATLDLAPAAIEPATCAHCGLPSGGRHFCCAGCEAAFTTIQGLGLGRYYRQRVLDQAARAPRPEAHEPRDLGRYVTTDAAGNATLTLAVDGLQCGACVWLIESVLAREPDLVLGRVNLTTRRLSLVWRGGAARAEALVARAEALGYRLVPFDPALLAAAQDRTGRALIRALAVAGFAAGNVMLMSLATWFGLTQGMGPATRALMHWVSALIALPAIAYAGTPFFRSAFAALRQWRTNMDVPISVGVILVAAMSLVESFRGGLHTYFDSAVTLLFFLLLGRVLDHQARGQARATAEQLLTLRAADVAVLQPDGSTRRVGHDRVASDARVLVGMGERVGVDGVVEAGRSTLDTSLVTGETVPAPAAPGSRVFAGTLNLGPALVVRATATGAGTLLAECVRLIEAAEARRGRFVVLADRFARRYAPAVHAIAAATFVFWWLGMGAGVADSLLTAAAVLIITCPCALALAVPAVQVLATSRLFHAGILLKSATALERLANVDVVVFDKTGTLTEPTPAPLANADAEAWRTAASLAAASRHPLARALLAEAQGVPAALGAVEHPGQGISLATAEGELRLGSRAFCGQPEAPTASAELWLARPGHAPVRFGFEERLRADAAATIARLRAMGIAVALASGDRAAPVRRVASALGITEVHDACTPAEKVALIERLRRAGRHVLMVGDGLNDGPSLAAAHVSASPATAADISQTVADVVFQGARLAPVVEIIRLARRARAAMRQNLALAIGYNAVMVPLAAAGWVTPWLAAIAMSSSSLLVLANSFRMQGRERR